MSTDIIKTVILFLCFVFTINTLPESEWSYSAMAFTSMIYFYLILDIKAMK